MVVGCPNFGQQLSEKNKNNNGYQHADQKQKKASGFRQHFVLDKIIAQQDNQHPKNHVTYQHG